ncbi:OmpA family protein [Cloacibacterium sp. TD35]|uniref:OmpA family protein n=1 Tax=Cloacibacterium sp. TD35 TaxID=2976818 RepID=UPI00237E6ADF|nr:OmpA family protein [Cloacibacterium sp. TD35]WDT67784.1 OmpA family protein [Cloacibacterium sp. TD35]
MSLIDLIKPQLNPELISEAAIQLGESESNISKALGSLFPAVLGVFAQHSKQKDVINALLETSSLDFSENLLEKAINSTEIQNIILNTLGEQGEHIISHVSEYSNVNKTSAETLLKIATAATLEGIKKCAHKHGLDDQGILSKLAEHRCLIPALLPAGMSLEHLGLENLLEKNTETPVEISNTTSHKTKEEVKIIKQETEEKSSFWKWLLPLLILGIVAWFLWNQLIQKEILKTETSTENITKIPEPIPADSLSDAQKKIEFKGIFLQVVSDGLEDRMITFLKADNYKNAKDDDALKSTWYEFDQVSFASGKSDQLASGTEQIANLIKILKAYPEVKIKIGAYTDKSGTETENIALSQARADFIKNELTKAGVGTQIANAEGYGSKFATLPATATEEERSIDRKIALRFTK